MAASPTRLSLRTSRKPSKPSPDTIPMILNPLDRCNGAGGAVREPLFEAMREQNRGVQAGATVCMAKMVECSNGVGSDDAASAWISDGCIPKVVP
ncbi:putative microtubule-associated protein TORTIFOLIA1-like isoform [Sesbania bispinosa]|nr:putative microtubule-associated protein TORTIFOLIA1-like isoform [Sesbania bispinosa]